MRSKPPGDHASFLNPARDDRSADTGAPLLVVARVRRPHGLTGEVSVDVATSFPERFQPDASLWWRHGERSRLLRLREVRPQGSRLLMRFEGIEEPEAARALSGGELCVPETEAFPAPEGFYYSHRVVGWRCEDAGGRPLGTVTGLEQALSGPMLTVVTPKGKEVLVPFVAAIVVRIDDAGGLIVLDPPGGLFDL